MSAKHLAPCPTPDKQKFNSILDAEKAMKRQGNRVKTYKCVCGSVHLTSARADSMRKRWSAARSYKKKEKYGYDNTYTR